MRTRAIKSSPPAAESNELSHGADVTAVTFLGADALASRGRDHKVRVWDLAARKQRGPALAVHKFCVDVLGAPDGSRGLAVGVDLLLFDSRTAKATTRIKAGPTAICCAAFDGNERVLAGGGKDSRFLLAFDLAQDAARSEVELGGAVESVGAFDDRIFATTSGSLLEFDRDLRERQRISLPQRAQKDDIPWPPCVFVTSSNVFINDGTLSVLDGEKIERVCEGRVLAVTNDGHKALVVRDEEAWLVTASTGKGRKLELENVGAVAFSPDGRSLVATDGPRLRLLSV